MHSGGAAAIAVSVAPRQPIPGERGAPGERKIPGFAEDLGICEVTRQDTIVVAALAYQIVKPMRDGTRMQRAIISYAFRITVAVHFAILYVLFFRLPNTLIGFQHFVVGVALTMLMVVIGSLFFADMLMLKHDGWTKSKLIDTCVGCIWLAVVGYLISNNLHAGIW